MSKRKRNGQQTAKKESSAVTLSETLDEGVLAKLKATKTALTKVAEENEEQRQAQLRKERKEREKNKSFEELLDEYGDMGKKY